MARQKKPVHRVQVCKGKTKLIQISETIEDIYGFEASESFI